MLLNFKIQFFKLLGKQTVILLKNEAETIKKIGVNCHITKETITYVRLLS